MAGRGRSAVLPAWMTATTNGAQDPSYSMSHQAYDPSPQYTDFDGRDPRAFRGSDPRDGDERYDRGGRSSERRRSRSRERSGSTRRDRDGDRDRDDRSKRDDKATRKEVDEGPVGEWRPKKRSSNFDVAPPGGMELPCVGSGSANLQASFTTAAQLNALQRYSGSSGKNPDINDTIQMQQTKHARRLYVGGIPPTTTEGELGDFLTDLIHRAIAEASEDGIPAIISVYINREKCYAFIELKSIELTTACVQFDGVKFPNSTGVSILRVRRPNDFKPELVPSSVLSRQLPVNLAALGIVSTQVGDGPGKIFVGGLPYNLTDENVQELLSVFGPLKSFHMVREAGSSNSKGYGFCEYHDMKVTMAAIEGLNGMQIGDKTLTVKLAGPAQSSSSASSSIVGGLAGFGGLNAGGFGGGLTLGNASLSMPALGGLTAAPLAAPIVAATPLNGGNIATALPTRVLKLCNMVTRQDLEDDQEFEDIREDVRIECSSHGEVLQVLIPREKEGYPSGVEGNIYVEFRESFTARLAALSLSGRKFADRTVVVEYFDEDHFARRMLS